MTMFGQGHIWSFLTPIDLTSIDLDLIWTRQRHFDVLFIPESYQAWVNIALI